MAARTSDGKRRRKRRRRAGSAFSPLSFLWGFLAGTLFAIFLITLLRGSFEATPHVEPPQGFSNAPKKQSRPERMPLLSETEKAEMSTHLAVGIWAGGSELHKKAGSVSLRPDGTANWHGIKASWRPFDTNAAILTLLDTRAKEKGIDFIISQTEAGLSAGCLYKGIPYTYTKVSPAEGKDP